MNRYLSLALASLVFMSQSIWLSKITVAAGTPQGDPVLQMAQAVERMGKELISEMVLRLYTIARMLNPLMPETNELLKKLIKENKKPAQPLFLRKE